MKRTLIFCAVMLAIAASSILAQGNRSASKACSAPEFRQFDFWIGEWDLNWGDSGKGTNIITAELDGCVVEENFSAMPIGTFNGRSVSSYDNAKNRWQQTWVDNNGGYLDFVGGWTGDRMILWREAVTDSGTFLQRMVWFDIGKNSLEWKWEKSIDGGSNWQTLWQIHYKRKE